MDGQAESICQKYNIEKINESVSRICYYKLQFSKNSPYLWHHLKHEFAYQLFHFYNHLVIFQSKHLSRQTFALEELSLLIRFFVRF